MLLDRKKRNNNVITSYIFETIQTKVSAFEMAR